MRTSNAPQVAINDIGGPEEFLAAVDASIKYFNDGDIVTGTVVKVDHDEVLLDIGYKTEGVILTRELSIKHDVDPEDVVEVGDEIDALVLTKEDKEGRLMLSKKRAQYERAWGTIEELQANDQPVTGTVIEVVKGGLILDIGLRGFLPASLVEMRRVRDLDPYIGQELEAKIIELDKHRNNVVLSRRAYLEETQSAVRSDFLHQLQKGQVRKGVVSSIVNFGAFVDLGGVDGLVHVSELAQRHVEVPDQVVNVGEEVMVKGIDIDLDRRRISLSLKQADEDFVEEFDPSRYGMADSYDEQGNYIFPEGFDPETNEWMEGYDEARQEWEARYAEAERRHAAHAAQIERHRAAAAEAAEQAGDQANYSSESAAAPAADQAEESIGSLASDEQLAALRDKLAGN